MSSGWCVLVPQKSLTTAKRRLGVPAEVRRSLAGAFLADTLSATGSADEVSRVVVVWDSDSRPPVHGAESWNARGLELNAALRGAAVHIRRSDPDLCIAVVPADLPALDPRELTACLRRAAPFDGAFLRDRAGTGTTVLTATAGSHLLPAYGPGSATAHRLAGLHELSGVGLGSLRHDVDDLSDLRRVLASSGPRTRAVWTSAWPPWSRSPA